MITRHCKKLIDGLKDYSENYQSSDEWIRNGFVIKKFTISIKFFISFFKKFL